LRSEECIVELVYCRLWNTSGGQAVLVMWVGQIENEGNPGVLPTECRSKSLRETSKTLC